MREKRIIVCFSGLSRAVFLLLALLGLTVAAAAQSDLSIKGLVTNDKGEALENVSVTASNVKTGRSVSTESDVKGFFHIDRLEDGATYSIAFSHVGYSVSYVRNMTLTRQNTSSLMIRMKPAQSQLDDVVVVGYGTVRKRDVTGAISSVQFNEKEASEITSVDKLLQGRVAGVYVHTGSEAPGGAVNVRIRGISTLTGGSEPLYVVDGVIINTATQDVDNSLQVGTNPGNSYQEAQNGLTGINPEDIENIEVLKDASATAIYGSRALNGVVLITTKRGRPGKANITLSSTEEFAQVSKKMPMLKGVDFANFRNDEAALQGAPPVYNLDSIQPIDWQDAIFRTGVSTNNRLSVSGAGERSNYFLAMGYLDNNGIIPRTGVKQGDVRLNITENATDRLKISSRTGLLYRWNSMTQATEQMGSASNSIIRSMLSKEPIVGTDSLSLADINEGVDGPNAWLKDYDDFSHEFRAIQSLSLDYKLLEGLTFHVLGGVDLRFKDRHRWFGLALGQGQAANGQLGYSALKSYDYNTEAMLIFDRGYGKHRINATGGMTYDNSILENSYTVNENFWTEDLRTHGLGTGARVFPYYEDNSQASILSALARVVYSYNDRYVLTVTGRYDGTSRFADGHKWGFFPSGALAWRASDEDFIKNLHIFSTLKPRIGFGITGNQAVSPYSTITRYAVDYYASNNSAVAVGAAPALIANKDLKWESSQQTNVGLETGFFRDRLLFTVDLYNKQTKDLLQQMSLPTSTGFTSMYINRGGIQNKGIELTADAVVLQGKVQWSVGGNIAFNRNKITDVGLPVGQFGDMELSAFLGTNVAGGNEFKEPANIFARGRPVGMFFGYRTRGIYQPSDVTQHPLKLAGVPLQAGDIYFVDQNGDGNIDDADKTIIGNPNPKFTYGFHSSVTYARFTLSVFVNGVYGNEIADGNKLKIDNTQAGTNVEQDAYFKAWSTKNPGGTYPRLLYYNGNFTDRILENGSFMRLGLITLSYKPSLHVRGISGLDVFVTGHNLVTLTHYSGFDPEVNSFTNDPLRTGVDWSSYPNTKSVMVGLNVNF